MFRFRQFSVLNEAAAFKVGTDAVLLGAAATLPEASAEVPLRVLDIGTGTGVVALCIAQRLSAAGLDFRLTGIDIDAPSAAEAARNFASSPWAERLEAQCVSLADFEARCVSSRSGLPPFDLIVSNPPYFEESLRNPDPRESAARHTDLLSYRDILRFAPPRLRPGFTDSDLAAPPRLRPAAGRLAVILPASCEVELCRTASAFSLRPDRILRVRTTSRKAPSRIIAEFVPSSGSAVPARREDLCIRDGEDYTEAYLALTSPFYLF